MDKPGMKMGATAKDGRGGRRAVVEEALAELKRMVERTDMDAVERRRAPPPAAEEEAPLHAEDCEACKEGTCTDPEHNEDALEELVAGTED